MTFAELLPVSFFLQLIAKKVTLINSGRGVRYMVVGFEPLKRREKTLIAFRKVLGDHSYSHFTFVQNFYHAVCSCFVLPGCAF